MKMIMLIQHAEKKEKSSKKYEVSKWSFGDAYSGDSLKYCLLAQCIFSFISIEIPDDAQINDELYTFSKFFNQGTNL